MHENPARPKLPLLIFGLLIGLCAIMLSAFFIEPPADVTGLAHPTLAELQIGGDGAVRHGGFLYYGAAFGVLIICLFVSCLAFGARKGERLGPLKTPIIFGLVLELSMFAGLIVTYRQYQAAGMDSPLFLGLPYPTAFMLFGLWFAPFTFAGIYLFFFSRWTMTPADEEAFKKLVESRRGGAEPS